MRKTKRRAKERENRLRKAKRRAKEGKNRLRKEKKDVDDDSSFELS